METETLQAVTERPWHTLDIRETERLLNTSSTGLTPAEAARRLIHYGPNEIKREKEIPWWETLLHQFTDPLIYILLIAAVVTAGLQHFTDTSVILAVVLINAGIGFTQERRAQQAMRSLADLSAPKSEVLRTSGLQEIASRDLVPGDIVVLTSGTRVPADLRLFHVQDLHIDESALTGESLAVRKSVEPLEGDTRVPGDQFNMVFSGSTVTRGRGWGYVVRTGTQTELGRIATAIRKVGDTATPLQEKMVVFGKQVASTVILLSLIVVSIGLLRGMTPNEVLLVAIALTVSAIPEGLPVVLTITFAVGVKRMARRNALIRSLPAVETLGSATVIGSDKTGTLTQNEMTVEHIWAGGVRYTVTGVGYNPDGEILQDGESIGTTIDRPLYSTLLVGILANEADPSFLNGSKPVGDPTELALYASAAKAGLPVLQLKDEYTEIDTVPFESEQRFMATLNDGMDGRYVFLKGAPEVVLERCNRQLSADGDTEIDRNAVRRAASELAGEGLRVLAMALRPYESDRIQRDDLNEGFTLAGLQGMRDPVRPEAVEAVHDAHSAGVRVLMLTGDHVDTASAVGRQLGLNSAGALEGERLNELSDDELDETLKQTNIYARVAPEHKLRIVNRLKAQNHIVAATGDGVNDAPALRAAHLGIAMGRSGTDVAREASDLVLADDNFATITAAIEEGRVVFANIRKVTFFLLSTTAGDILAIITAMVLGWPVPFTPAQILWVNLVTNGLQDVALAFEPPEPGLLRRPPRPHREGVVTLRLFERFFGVGIILAAGTLGMFWWTWTSTGDVDLARTVAMTQIVVFNFYHVFNSRSLDASITKIPLFSNKFLFISIVAAALAQLAVLHVPFLQSVFATQPLSADLWAVMLLIGTTIILSGELDKWRNRKRDTPIG